MPELLRGTVTFLFTDIEGSTRLLRQLGERYEEVLADHRRILREAFKRYAGQEMGTEGDSFFIVFGRAKDAVAAAAEAQRALTAHRWPDGADVRVRMGMHTGEPVVASEGYVGLGVHRAARIMSAGHGGQVLLSQATRELLLDDPSPVVSLRDLGTQRLKDFETPERIYQLVLPDLCDSFPPLKTVASQPDEATPLHEQVAEAAASASPAEGRARPAPPRPRRRPFALAGATVVLLAAVAALVIGLRGDGAEGGPTPLSKDRYEDRVLDAARPFSARLVELERDLPSRVTEPSDAITAATKLTTLRMTTDRLVATLESLTPPNDVKDLHRRITELCRRIRTTVAVAGAASDAGNNRAYRAAPRKLEAHIRALSALSPQFRSRGYERLGLESDQPAAGGRR